MVEQEGQPKGDFMSYAYARAAGLAADPQVDAAKAVEWAESAVAKQRIPWYLHAAGLAYFRAGELDKAKQTLQESLKGAWGSQILNQLVLGMVEHKLGNDEAAAGLLDAARKWQKEKAVEAAKRNGYVNVQLPDWLEFNALMPELEAMIAEGPREVKPAHKP
jgi:tetratricopeptide (TPR) repeat protein